MKKNIKITCNQKFQYSKMLFEGFSIQNHNFRAVRTSFVAFSVIIVVGHKRVNIKAKSRILLTKTL